MDDEGAQISGRDKADAEAGCSELMELVLAERCETVEQFFEYLRTMTGGAAGPE